MGPRVKPRRKEHQAVSLDMRVHANKAKVMRCGVSVARMRRWRWGPRCWACVPRVCVCAPESAQASAQRQRRERGGGGGY